MAHVSTFTFTALPGKRQAVLNIFKEWDAAEQAQSFGFQRSLLVTSNRDADRFTAIVFWDTTENYNKNSERPETNAWYKKFRATIASDPEWFDGTVTADTTNG